MDFFFYLLKVNIACVFLYVVFRLIFGRDTFFGTKRFVFLAILLFSLLYPFFQIPDISGGGEVIRETTVYFVMPEIVITPQFVPEEINWIRILTYIYLAGILIFSIRFMIQTFTLLKIIYRSVPTEIDGIKIRATRDIRIPFSFFNHIVLNPDLYNRHELREILIHEATHVKQKHSFDVIFCELLCIFCWFNPLIRLMKKEMQMNLEYMADKTVMTSDCDSGHYQLHLLQLSYPEAIANISNKFNVSPLKKRIKMMNRKKTPPAGIMKYALLLPLMVGLLFVNNLQAQKKEKPEQPAQPKKEVSEPMIANNLQAQKPEKSEKQEKPPKPITAEVVDSPTNPVFYFVEQLPFFPGGDAALMKFLSENLKYPPSAAESRIQGRLVCQFVIRATGKVDDIKVVQGVSPALDKEAVRLIASMPDWIPGKQNGIEVDTYYSVPITFRLEEPTPRSTPQENSLKEVVVVGYPPTDTTQKEVRSDGLNAVYEVNGKIVSKEEADKLIKSGKIQTVSVIRNSQLPAGESGNRVIMTLKE